MSDKALLDLSDQGAERALIGAALLNNDLPKTPLTPDNFYLERHKYIWVAIVEVSTQGGLDIETVTHQLERDKKLKTIGGAAYLAKCITETPNNLHVEQYAKRVKDLAERRQAYLLLRGSMANVYDQSSDIYAVTREAIAGLKQLDQNINITIPDLGNWQDLRELLGPIEWDWEPWLPKGMLTILAGESGSGKSALALRLAGCFVLGWTWPNGEKFSGDPGAVLWCEAEAAQAVNLDRAKKWGLPLDKIYTPFDNPLTDIQLDQAPHKGALAIQAQRDDIRLIVVDSLRGAHSRDENSSETMDLVKWLAQLARDSGKPILLTHHLRKKSIFDGEKIDQDRLRGSSAIVQAARLVWALDVPDPYIKDWKRLQVIKSNLAHFPEPVGMTINKQGVVFGDAPEEPKIETVADKAADLLLALLDSEPLQANEVRDQIEQAGISWVSAKRAKSRLGIVSIKREDGKWYWSLPAKGDYVN